MKTMEMTSKIYDMLLADDPEMSTYARQILQTADIIYVVKDGEKRVIPIRQQDNTAERLLYYWLLKIDYRVAIKSGTWNDRIINDSGEIVMKNDQRGKEIEERLC